MLSAITEFPLPTGHGSAGDLTVGPDGNLWFTESGAIGRITPAGAITQFPLPASSGAGSLTVGHDDSLWFIESGAIGRITPAGAITQFPLPTAGFGTTVDAGDLTAGPDGNLWFTENSYYPSGSNILPPTSGPVAIDRITPAGVITDFPLPAGQSSAGDLTAGPDGNLWFTESTGSSAGPGAIGRITPTGAITTFSLPGGNSAPSGLTEGPDGNLWFIGGSPYGKSPGAIDRITPAGAITQFPLPAGQSSLPRLTVGPDGNLWFPEYYESIAGGFVAQFFNTIGRITPEGTITQFPLPTVVTSASALTVGPDGNLWFTEGSPYGKSPAAIGRITPAGAITQFPLPAGDSFPPGLTVGPDGTLWFTDSSEIGRLDPTPPRVTGVVAVAHSRKATTSIVVRFDEALNPASASKVRAYGLAAALESGQTIVYGKPVKIARVSYDRAAHAVRLKLAVPQKGPVQVTVRAGIAAADGMSISSDFTAVVT